jgi:hypothetical protein
MRRPPTLIKSLVFAGVLIVHWTALFLAEAYAERSTPMRILDRILAVPLVSIAGPLTFKSRR